PSSMPSRRLHPSACPSSMLLSKRASRARSPDFLPRRTPMPSMPSLLMYWSERIINANAVIILNLLGALALGLMVGYERSYHGRAAGMRTYGLVCMASAAWTVIAGYPSLWFGGHVATGAASLAPLGDDPTRVIQGIVTGIGFLGAGVIMREGFNISGLTTAASIWSSSAIGVLVGLGFYLAGILVALLSMLLMIWAIKIEQWLPSHPAFAVMLRFKPGLKPEEAALAALAREHGLILAGGTIQIQRTAGRQEWRFVVVSETRRREIAVSRIAERLCAFEGVEEF